MSNADEARNPYPPNLPGAELHSVPSRPSIMGGVFRWIGRLAVALSFAFNFLILLLVVKLFFLASNWSEDASLHEHVMAGKRLAADKIAVVRVEGAIMEGMLGYARKQIEQAADDDSVKAVVLRVNSPGGSITASDDLYKRLQELRDGNSLKKTHPKPLVVSMASLAASGGYYIAMPAKQIMAERTTVTGSIGVYAALPNIADLADKYGVKMNVIKAGEVKDSGSMFHEMTPQERQLWQDMVDHAFQQFLAVVKEGRGNKLKYDLREEIKEESKSIPDQDKNGNPVKDKKVLYTRRLADGGIFTSEKAKRYGLIDDIGYLDDAIAVAHKTAGLGDDYKVVTYERTQPLLYSLLLGEQSVTAPRPLNPGKLPDAAMPRLWYLTPQAGLSGILTAGFGE